MRSCLSIAQAKTSFKHLDTCHITPTFITEALRFVAYVFFLKTVKVKGTAYTTKAN